MDSQQFVAAIERYVRDGAIEHTIANLKQPPGRRVPIDVKARSNWYINLSDEDRDQVNKVVAIAAHAAVFGFLASLDGVRKIHSEDGRFELFYIDEESVLLNPESVDLHDLLGPPI